MINIIYFYSNMDKSIKKEKKKKMKKIYMNMKTDLTDLLHLNNNDFAKTLEYIRLYSKNINNDDINYLKNYLKNNLKDNYINIKQDNLSFLNPPIESEISIDSERENEILNVILKISNRLEKIMKSKSFKVVITFAITIFFAVLSMLLHYNNILAVSCMTPLSELPNKIDTAYSYIKALGGIVAFVFLCVELIQSGLKGDTRAMGMILAKYILFAVALLSFKSVWNLIDGFFNS